MADQVGDIVLPRDPKPAGWKPDPRLEANRYARQNDAARRRAAAAPAAETPADEAVRKVNDANPLKQVLRRVTSGRTNYSGRSGGRSSGR